jgi:hypothetical protein
LAQPLNLMIFSEQGVQGGAGYQATNATQRWLFNAILETTRTLREARITMYSVNQLDPQSPGTMRTEFYKSFLKGVPSPRQAESGDLSLPFGHP